jgi:hypothetical protein
VDNWHSLWRSALLAENAGKSAPPYMGMVFDRLQDVDWVRKRLLLWINLWMSIPDSFHRKWDAILWIKPNI